MLELELSRSGYGPIDTRNANDRDFDALTPAQAVAAAGQQVRQLRPTNLSYHPCSMMQPVPAVLFSPVSLTIHAP
jgi:hypothetical protein